MVIRFLASLCAFCFVVVTVTDQIDDAAVAELTPACVCVCVCAGSGVADIVPLAVARQKPIVVLARGTK